MNPRGAGLTSFHNFHDKKLHKEILVIISNTRRDSSTLGCTHPRLFEEHLAFQVDSQKRAVSYGPRTLENDVSKNLVVRKFAKKSQIANEKE